MATFAELDEIARMLAMQSHVTASKEVAAELWRLAQQYRVQAGTLDDGKLPNIGNPPALLTRDGPLEAAT